MPKRLTHRSLAARIPDGALAEIVSRKGLRVLPSFARSLTAALRQRGFRQAKPRLVCNADLPLGLSIYCDRLQTTPGFVLQAPVAAVCRCECALEAGIPRAWCASLSSADDWRPIYRILVACPRMVRDRKEWSARTLGSWNASRQSKEGT